MDPSLPFGISEKTRYGFVTCYLLPYATITCIVCVAPTLSTDKGVKQFRHQLLTWFDREKRDLPWRGTGDPYHILVSEIMLQQTRVAVVLERYKKFIAQFPGVERLARAREQTVLAAWSGLGYYRRARSLHAAAWHISRAGAFPGSAAELALLPGIGRYTAAAVASIAFGEPVAVVDGNVKRVIERLAGAPRKTKRPSSAFRQAELWQIAGKLLDSRRPGDFNQAMMELGALVCLPAGPLCPRCPVASLCASRGRTTKSKQRPRQKALLAYGLLRKNGRVLLHQRPDDSRLMPGMWELPPLSGRLPARTRLLMTLRHSITNTDYVVQVFSLPPRKANGRWVPLENLDRLALTGLTRKILQRL
jgi:A/G-specific adenine glycosylase